MVVAIIIRVSGVSPDAPFFCRPIWTSEITGEVTATVRPDRQKLLCCVLVAVSRASVMSTLRALHADIALVYWQYLEARNEIAADMAESGDRHLYRDQTPCIIDTCMGSRLREAVLSAGL